MLKPLSRQVVQDLYHEFQEALMMEDTLPEGYLLTLDNEFVTIWPYNIFRPLWDWGRLFRFRMKETLSE